MLVPSNPCLLLLSWSCLHLHTSLAFREPWVILGHASTQDPNPFTELSHIQIKKYERGFCIRDAFVNPGDAELWKSQCDEKRQLFVSVPHLLLSLRPKLHFYLCYTADINHHLFLIISHIVFIIRTVIP